MSLTRSELARAGEVLNQLQLPEVLKVRLQGVDTFPGRRRNAAVGFLSPRDDEGRLMGVAERVKQRFEEEGLLVGEGERELVLHGTVFNTVYASGEGSSRVNIGAKGGGIEGDATSTKNEEEEEDDPWGQNLEQAQLQTRDAAAKNSNKRGKGKWKRKKPIKVDITKLVEACEEKVWLEECLVDRIGIYKMGAKAKDGIKGGGGYEAVFERRF